MATAMVVMCAMLASACGGATETPLPAIESAPGASTALPAGDPYRIVFLGDSISAGFGLAESQAFPALVQARLRAEGHAVDVINAGVSGDTTAGGLARLDWVLRTEPDLLVVELGGNDALRGQPIANIERNLRDIVRDGKRAGARVLVLGMDIPRNYGREYGEDFAGLYERVAAAEDVPLVPEFVREVGMTRRLMLPDGIHPTAEGHQVLADSLISVIEEMIDDAP